MSTAGFSFLLIFIIALMVLFAFIKISHRQQMLNEKKARYGNFIKKRKFHFNRYQAYQKDIERLNSVLNEKFKDMTLLSMEIEDRKKIIKEILDILREEDNKIEEQTDPSFIKIVDRRKSMFKEQWEELNGDKTAYLEKYKQVQADMVPIENLKSKKNNEFRVYSEMRSEEERLKGEYENILQKPVFLLKIKGS